MTVFAIEKRKKSYKLSFVLILLIVSVVISFSIGLLAGYLATAKEEEGSGSERRSYGVEDLLKLFRTENLRNTTRYFSSKPHQSGSQRSKELADEIRAIWNSYGFHVDTVEYDVLLPRAKDDIPDYIEIRDSDGNVTMRHTFAAVGKSDPGSNKTWTIPRYIFYSPSGSVQGGLLYVNEGRKEDFDHLKKINITSCNGSVVLIKRVNHSLLKKQLKNAYDCQASGVLLFMKEQASNDTRTDNVYPNGTNIPGEALQVFGLARGWQIGDLLTPDLPASQGIYRLDEKDLDLLSKLPVQLVEFDIAKKLLNHLQGSQLPEEWKLSSQKTEDYRIGPLLKENLTLHMIVNSKAQRTKIYDVIGTVYGRDEPDDWVLVGNHRDAITFGAVDAGSGTAGIMELSRGIGELLKKGWKPRRTIKFCSWSAEEIGIIGSTEYVEDNKKLLQERAVAYINMDVLVHGNESLKASGNPLMLDLIYSQTKLVEDPHGSNETIYSVWKKRRAGTNGKPQFYTPGFGSDYIPFYEIAGVPCIDLQYAKVPYGLPQTYHTVYDTYHLVSMFDPHFQFHLAQTKLSARLVYELANSILVPFNLNSFTSLLKEIVNRTSFFYDKELKPHGITLSTVIKETLELVKAGRKFEKMKNESKEKTNKQKIRQLNRRMVTFNKIFISPEYIPERFNMRNLVLGISENYGYPNITLAGISDAIIAAQTSGRWEIVKRQVSLTQHAITQARRFLEMP